MRIFSIVGARPQFIKAAVVSHALAEAGIEELLLHTGQHYDAQMSRVFFDELGIPEPTVNFGVGSGTHAVQTGEMMIHFERFIMENERPDWVMVYGDTNSTIAGAMVAAKLQLPLAHVEAGLRSFNRRMPEEINRVVTDHLSNLLFCPTVTAIENLTSEGITKGVHLNGDVMLDATRFYAARAAAQAPLSDQTNHAPNSFYLATVHRAENTDDPERLRGIFEGFGRLNTPVVIPLHPRTQTRLSAITVPPNVDLIEPVSYLTMLTLIQGAKKVLTDSGGLQKEAVWLDTPCITLRDETEWVETLEGGWNRLVSADPDRIVEAVLTDPTGPAPSFGAVDEGRASEIIARRFLEH